MKLEFLKARESGIAVEERDPKKPKLVEQVTSPTNIDWARPLHEQLKPRLWGNPDEKLTAADLSEIRKESPQWLEEYLHEILLKNAACLNVLNRKRNTRELSSPNQYSRNSIPPSFLKL